MTTITGLIDTILIAGVQIDRGIANAWHHGAAGLSVDPMILRPKMPVGLGETPDTHGLTANEFQNCRELFRRICVQDNTADTTFIDSFSDVPISRLRSRNPRIASS